jgi:hypothetical protein
MEDARPHLGELFIGTDEDTAARYSAPSRDTADRDAAWWW